MKDANGSYRCSNEGLLLPLMDESEWSIPTRAVLYFLALLYSFLGIAIAADVFMCAIERITSQKTKVKVNLGDEEDSDKDDISDTHPVYREVMVWNPTVANLTLMALGSSAPEILLSIIEIVGNNFNAGELGPSTIVGSAAFNLLVISSICIISIPNGETRRIQEIMVFGVTASFCVFAYVWLLIILKGFSPDQVEVWEGFMTLVFFVTLIVAAYAAEKKICFRAKPKLSSTKDVEKPLNDAVDNIMMSSLGHRVNRAPYTESEWHELEKHCHQMYPNIPTDELAKLVAYRIQEQQPHSSLWYRIQGSRLLSSSRKTQAYWDANLRQNQMRSAQSMSTIPGAPSKRVVEFASRIYSITPGQKFVRLKILRKGRNTKQLLFNYQTVNGQAKKNVHFLPKNETVMFEPRETEKMITVELMEEAQWKPDDVFYVRLGIEDDDKTTVGKCAPAEIVYRDPKGAPTIEFTKNHAAVKESTGTVRLNIIRRGGFTGGAYVNWETSDITAEEGSDYIGGVGQITFEAGELEKYLDIPIIDDMVEEKAETFAVVLKDPSPGTELGYNIKNIVTILCDDGATRYFRQMDRMVPDFLRILSPGKTNWKEQIIRATSVNAGDVDNATFMDCVGHILSFPFKVIFSLVPPPGIFGGWLTFFVALILIGLITAVVGDLASIFGCLVGLEKSVTAITFVALGTSLPDTFASKLAAVQEKTADNSIGNVTGSNSVNVFLGLGLPWFMASVYWATKGKPFDVPAGSLGFSVGIYTVCSLLCIAMLMARRFLPLFGKAELGGPTLWKYLSGAFGILLWFIYVLFSALQAYGYF